MKAIYTGKNTKTLTNGAVYDVRRSEHWLPYIDHAYWVMGNDKYECLVAGKHIHLIPEPKHNNPETYTQYELENLLQNAITYGIKEITGHTIGDKIASVLVDEFLDTLDTRENTNSQNQHIPCGNKDKESNVSKGGNMSEEELLNKMMMMWGWG